jgi:hypothetical protein
LKRSIMTSQTGDRNSRQVLRYSSFTEKLVCLNVGNTTCGKPAQGDRWGTASASAQILLAVPALNVTICISRES